jgi:hypothetical protein
MRGRGRGASEREKKRRARESEKKRHARESESKRRARERESKRRERESESKRRARESESSSGHVATQQQQQPRARATGASASEGQERRDERDKRDARGAPATCAPAAFCARHLWHAALPPAVARHCYWRTATHPLPSSSPLSWGEAGSVASACLRTQEEGASLAARSPPLPSLTAHQQDKDTTHLSLACRREDMQRQTHHTST